MLSMDLLAVLSLVAFSSLAGDVRQHSQEEEEEKKIQQERQTVPTPITAPQVTEARSQSGEKEAVTTLTWENDGQPWILQGASSDHYYTNGVRFSRTYSRRENAPRICRWLESALRPVIGLTQKQPDKRYLGFVLGQNLYTPTDLTDTEPIVGDRPYGAWLYGGVRVHAFGGYRRAPKSRSDWTDSIGCEEPALGSEVTPRCWVSPRRVQVFELDLGVIGPLAGGRETQTLAHAAYSFLMKPFGLRAPKPMGWDHQVDGQAGVLLTYGIAQRLLAFRTAKLGFGRWFDATASLQALWSPPHARAFRRVIGGIEIRLGYNLGRGLGVIENAIGGSDRNSLEVADFLIDDVIPAAGYLTDVSVTPSPAPDEDPGLQPLALPQVTTLSEPFKLKPAENERFEIQLFASWLGTRSFANTFVDCEKCRTDHEIEPTPTLRDWVGGVAVRFGDFRIAWRLIFRGSEFKPERQGRGQLVGSWNCTW